MMVINTVQAPKRAEPVANPRRNSDGSFSGALERELNDENTDLARADHKGVERDRARSDRARSDQARSDEARRDRVRKHADDGSGGDHDRGLAHAEPAQATKVSQSHDRIHDGRIHDGQIHDSQIHDSQIHDGQIHAGHGHAGEARTGKTHHVEAPIAEGVEATEGSDDVGSAAGELGDIPMGDATAGGISAEQSTDGTVGASTDAMATESSTTDATAAVSTVSPGSTGTDSTGSDSTAGGQSVEAQASKGGVGAQSDPSSVTTSGTTTVDASTKVGGGATGNGPGEALASHGNAGETSGVDPDGAEVAGLVDQDGSANSGESQDLLGAGAGAAESRSASGSTDKVVTTTDAPNATSLLNSAASSHTAPVPTTSTSPEILAPAQTGGFDMSKLGEGIATRIRSSEKVQSLSLELHPAELGAVRVDVRQIDGVTHLVLTPDRPTGGQRLAAAMADLRHDLERSGVNIGDLQLRQDSSGGGQESRGGSDGRIGDQHRSVPIRATADPPVTARRSARLNESQQRVAIDL